MHSFSVVPRIFWEAGFAQSVRSLTSRFGPTVPVADAAASVWHPLHPAEPVNTAWPAAALVLDELDEEDVLGADDEPLPFGTFCA